jgi:hypothetical protein
MGILRHIYVYMTGERQLLDENKERSGDNRAIRQNRTHRKSEADKQATPALPQIGGADAVKAEGDKNPIGQMNSTRVIDPSRREELSAQRRKKNKLSVFGISNPGSYEPQPRTIVSQSWTATASRWVTYQDIGPFFYDYWAQDYQQQRTNSYTIIPSQKWSPAFAKEASSNRTYINAPTHELGKTAFTFDWTFWQTNLPDGAPGNSFVVATTPQLPEPVTTWFNNHPRVSLNHLPAIASSDGRYIWYSVVYALSRPSSDFYISSVAGDLLPYKGLRNDFFDTQNGGEYVFEVVSRRTLNNGSPQTDPTSGYNHDYLGYEFNNDNYARYRNWDFAVTSLNLGLPRLFSDVQAYGLTWRYDTENPQSPPNFSEFNLGYTGDGTLAGFHNFASMYLGLLDASHPAKEEWTQMLARKTANESFAELANRYFDPTYGSGFYSLVPGLVYYKDTGLAIYTGKLKRGNFFPNFPRVYTKTLTPNLSYSSASYRMPYPSSNPGSYFREFLTTHEDMIANGWEEQADAPVTQFGTALPYYFTHRLK